MMPKQLATAKRPRRSEPRPLAECLPRINVNDLQIPRDYKTYIAPDISFRYPEISNMRISAYQVEFAHNHRIQTFKLKWIRTGAGVPRPAFICDQCARPVISLYFRSQNLGCRRCVGAIYASQVCGKHGRKALQSHRVRQSIASKHAAQVTLSLLASALGTKRSFHIATTRCRLWHFGDSPSY
jgi:hypothetical protein